MNRVFKTHFKKTDLSRDTGFPLGGALFIFFTCFILYLFTLNPVFLDDDSAETITAAATLGLQHPPGYALAALLGRCFSLLPLGSPCFRLNTGSALFASLAVVLFAAFLHRALQTFEPAEHRAATPFGSRFILFYSALSGALLLAFSKTYWEKSGGAKGFVYILGTLLIFLLLHCALEKRPSSKSFSWQPFLAFFIFGLGFSNHWETHLLFFPLLAVIFIKISLAKVSLNLPSPKRAPLLLGLFLIGASPLLYLPLRAHLEPILNLGNPDTHSYFLADFFRHYTSERETSLAGAFFEALRGASSWKPFQDAFQQIMEIQGRQISAHLWEEIKLPGLLLSGLGLFVWARSNLRKELLAVLFSFALLLLALCSAAWIPTGPSALWYVDNFLIPANWTAGFLAAGGLYGLYQSWPQSKLKIFTLTLMSATLLFSLAFSNFENENQKYQMMRYDYGVNLLKSTPRGAILFAEADEDYFPLYYLQAVGHQRPDVRMIPAFILFEPWGVSQIEKRYPELGLTASSVSFPDHFAQIIYAVSEIVVKNRGKRPIGFSFFNGAFHHYYEALHPQLPTQRSGMILELKNPLTQALPPLPLEKLRTRHWLDCPSNQHPSLHEIRLVYKILGLSPD